MDLINMSWHIGAVLLMAWGLWLIYTQKTDRQELLDAVLPCSLGSAPTIPRGRFLRAGRCLLRIQLGAVLRGRADLQWKDLPSTQGSSLEAEHAREALAQLHRLGTLVMRGSGHPVAIEGSLAEVFLWGPVGSENSIETSCSDLADRLRASKPAQSFVFQYIGPTQSRQGTLYWSVVEV